MSMTANGVGAWVGPVLVNCSSAYLNGMSVTPSAKPVAREVQVRSIGEGFETRRCCRRKKSSSRVG
jgi:hypothetical protein